MNKCQNLPDNFDPHSPSRNVRHPAGQKVPPHYHNAEECLEVLDGEITFFPASGKAAGIVVAKGELLEIPRGEVHRVEIGANGVEYRMWLLPNVPPDNFSNPLDADDLDLVKKNLDIPEHENSWDANRTDAVAEGHLRDFVHTNLVFRTGKGKLIFGRENYIGRNPATVKREADDAVRILIKTPDTILFLTTVYTVADGQEQRAATENYRLFVKEDGVWRCLVWINCPAP